MYFFNKNIEILLYECVDLIYKYIYFTSNILSSYILLILIQIKFK